MIYCDNCGLANRDGSRFCNECGHLLGDWKRCPHCDFLNPSTGRFCNQCGDRLQALQPQAVQPLAVQALPTLQSQDRPESEISSRFEPADVEEGPLEHEAPSLGDLMGQPVDQGTQSVSPGSHQPTRTVADDLAEHLFDDEPESDDWPADDLPELELAELELAELELPEPELPLEELGDDLTTPEPAVTGEPSLVSMLEVPLGNVLAEDYAIGQGDAGAAETGDSRKGTHAPDELAWEEAGPETPLPEREHRPESDPHAAIQTETSATSADASYAEAKAADLPNWMDAAAETGSTAVVAGTRPSEPVDVIPVDQGAGVLSSPTVRPGIALARSGREAFLANAAASAPFATGARTSPATVMATAELVVQSEDTPEKGRRALIVLIIILALLFLSVVAIAYVLGYVPITIPQPPFGLRLPQ